MKKVKIRPLKPANNDMRKEYDFTGRKGVRGKYYRAYRKGHTVRIHEADGTVSVHHFTLRDGAVMLEPDVQEYFPTSKAVNTALRSLIALVPAKRKTINKPRKAGMKA